jgi:protein-L-isoaspartate(D-aspartate) O-methyltransferase
MVPAEIRISGDSYRHQGQRKKLVAILKEKGIGDQRVLNAIASVPRHLFLDPAFDGHAYEDKAFQIGSGQTISQPYTVAYQSAILNLEPGMKVLEIGTGSGYQASVLAEMGAKVYSIERQKALYQEVRVRLRRLGYRRIQCFFGDGFKGVPSFAPYQRILITAAAPELPAALLDQLEVGGYLVVPYGEGEDQLMMRIRKEPNGQLIREDFDRFRFVPMLKGTENRT